MNFSFISAWHPVLQHFKNILLNSRDNVLTPLSLSQAFQVALEEKNPPASAGDTKVMGSLPGSGAPVAGGHGSPLQRSCLENPADRGAEVGTAEQTHTNGSCASQVPAASSPQPRRTPTLQALTSGRGLRPPPHPRAGTDPCRHPAFAGDGEFITRQYIPFLENSDFEKVQPYIQPIKVLLFLAPTEINSVP